MAAGLALALVWHANRTTSRLLGIAGIALLAATALGFGEDVSGEAQAFFNGMSVAMPVGFGLSAWWRWDRFRPFLVAVARIEDVRWLLRVLGER